MKKVLLLSILLLFAYTPVVHAQSLDIPIKGYGISFGNSKNFTGLRFNWADSGVEQINGINLTFAGGNNGASLNGINLGLVAVAGHDISINGIALSPFLVGGKGASINGIALSPFLVGGKGASINGIALGFGVGGAEGGSMNGIALSGIGVAFDKIRGIAIGWAVGAVGENLSEPTTIGIQLGLLGSVTKKGIGFSFGGIINGADEFNGIAIGGLFNKVEKMNGLQIGLLNNAEELNGIQIGLINYAGNNTPGLQWLPLINAHFSF